MTIISAGTHVVIASDGSEIHVDQPIGREMADVIVAVIRNQGLTLNDVTAVEFHGEGPPILHRPGQRYDPKESS